MLKTISTICSVIILLLISYYIFIGLIVFGSILGSTNNYLSLSSIAWFSVCIILIVVAILNFIKNIRGLQITVIVISLCLFLLSIYNGWPGVISSLFSSW